MKLKIRFFLPLFLMLPFAACENSQNGITPIQSTPVFTAQTDEAKKTPLPTDLRKLREWVGKYPINPTDKKYANFFELPEVKKNLIQILKEDGFQNLLKHFNGTNLIKEKDGFLVMLGTTAKNDEQDVDYGLVALNPETGETHVLFSDANKLTAFSNASDDGNLTANIKKEILVYADSANTGSAKSTAIGTLKQKPVEGFQCYAVSPKDWNTIADKRQYIFVSTETGGILNVEGTDIELKTSNSTETKGENGKTYVEWIYGNKETKAKFDLAVEKLLNEGADVQYEGTLTVTTKSKTQTIQIKAFCGG